MVPKDRREKPLYSSCPPEHCTVGAYPDESGPVRDSAGNLYGGTPEVGPDEGGTNFKVG
jgi:hypothetical protein